MGKLVDASGRVGVVEQLASSELTFPQDAAPDELREPTDAPLRTRRGVEPTVRVVSVWKAGVGRGGRKDSMPAADASTGMHFHEVMVR